MNPGPTAQATVVTSPSSDQAIPDYVLHLERAASYLPKEQLPILRRAWEVGASAHAGQTRKSGEPYITHPVAVAGVLAELGLDMESLIAAILHDTIEDTPLTREELASEFGEAVAELVDGVTKLDKLKFRDRQEAAAESFRKMLLAMSRDLRVIMIKLADRLHNMRTLGAQSSEARSRIARETLEIYAPIAQRLGMSLIKSELQNLASAHCIRGVTPSSKNISAASRWCGANRWRRWKCSCRSGWPRKGWSTAWSAASRRPGASIPRCTKRTSPSTR
ncbi:hypothetical protein XPR_1631 [Xanthomonas arboricola pv. pruni MAFF 301420]|uniref:HD domain-containing protein n=2 Tax=Xanthomonas arboricola pv. pruni TaxID=69929 RepID=W4SES2_9XANT|nr:guanosine-3',5'-bis(diphosphate)3'-pyrophosphohydrolase [Xanthomonas arboricola pv. pruni str. MAFF 311562]GAE54996.1 hypothetical protein XPR_1631 [Xanthomonas arboricola pv. pruni MAFF 301420]GAE59419.1 hypothetical protein XPN_1325 [Xanthomonas arboricola pv. pruni MAFF 301427]